MRLLDKITAAATAGPEPSHFSVAELEASLGGAHDQAIFAAGRQRLLGVLGNACYLRGIIELSNACRKNCYYCGLRRDNHAVERYTMRLDEVQASLEEGYAAGLRSFLVQSGELLGESHLALVEAILRWTAQRWGDGVRMVLSLGELPPAWLERLRRAGGHRYLLRIETSDRALYAKMHPQDDAHDYGERWQALQALRAGGWQTGTGVLIGVPGQSLHSLAQDLLLMQELDIDMCGMGPYVEHDATPMAHWPEVRLTLDERVDLDLRMIALMRLMLPTINIAATTALQTLAVDGLERGLNAGANVFMPNITPLAYRTHYNLYRGKRQVPDTLDVIIARMGERCAAIGREIRLGEAGDSRHFLERTTP